MKVRTKSKISVLFFQLSIIAFVIVLYRSLLIPFTHDEVATFIYYIQPGEFMPFNAHIDANNHILNSGLSFFFFKLLGDSPFVLRIPNLIAFILLIIGVFRISKLLDSSFSKFVLFILFLFSFPFISFFSVCRGYGLSMGLLVLSLSYFINYIKNPDKTKYFLLFTVFIQLALSSNLTLIILTVLVQFYILLFQFIKNKILHFQTLIIHLISFLLIIFWVYYLFFLKENNALYLGKGSNIWEVTYLSLVNIFVGSKENITLNIIIIIFVIIVTSLSYILIFQSKGTNIRNLISDQLFVILSFFVLLILLFFVQKYLIHINFPEGRAALYLYPLFALIFVFYLDKSPGLLNKAAASLLVIAYILQFFLSLNFSKHSIEEYVTIPDRFYTYLEKEQTKSPEQITIGGHPYRELIFNFINYRNGGKLNLENPSGEMNLYSDYYLADILDSSVYNKYYNTIDSEPNWGYTLLKRKEFAKRTLIWSSDKIIEINNDQEYNNLFSFNDTTFYDTFPLLINIEFDVIESPIPNNTSIILEINDSTGNNNIYKRLPLNWLKYDWNNTYNNQYQIMTENVPTQCKRIICYFWNFQKMRNQIKINKINIYRLTSTDLN